MILEDEENDINTEKIENKFATKLDTFLDPVSLAAQGTRKGSR